MILCEHPLRSERLEIYIDEIYSDTSHQAFLSGRLIKLGSEREFSDLLYKHLDVVAPGLRPLRREAPTPVGPIDILATDLSGEVVVLVAIEVKRGRGVGPEVAYQVQRYLDALEKMPEWAGQPKRGIVIAPGLAKGCKELLVEKDIEYIRLSLEDLQEKTKKAASKDESPLAELITSRREEVLLIATRRGCQNLRLFDPRVRGEGPERELDILVDVTAGTTLVAVAGLAVELSALLNGRALDVTTLDLLEDDVRDAVLAAARPL
jgi:predicted nucleotidyltransferase